MLTIRYDIISLGDAWFLTDGEAMQRILHTSAGALSIAKADAEARRRPAVVYLWNGDTGELVFKLGSPKIEPAPMPDGALLH